MIKKILLAFIYLLISFNLLLTPVATVSAQEQPQFATNYNITYSVSEDGVTEVTENITLKNLTDRFYASTFTLIIGATQISDLTARDASGELPTKMTKEGNQTKLEVTFTQQLSGLNKEYPWTLKFKSKDFAEKQGKIWQVSVPKVSSPQTTDIYNLTLSVPVSFGDPSTISPSPLKTSEANGKLLLSYNKELLLSSGVLAVFGTEQQFNFSLGYLIENTGVLPTLSKVNIPSNQSSQQVIIRNITPKPENVVVDRDGNYAAFFKVPPKQSLKVQVEGISQIKSGNFGVRLTKEQQETYLKEDKYWEKSNPQLKTTLSEIFKDKPITTNEEKARLISQFVASSLSFDSERLASGNFERLGALTTLVNPTKALASDYTDLFIALSRAAEIPSRKVIGFAYSSNQDVRPQSFNGTALHTWPEFYDERMGWVMVDPTWQSTSGGADYSSKASLNHLNIATLGTSSQEPLVPQEVNVTFSESEFQPVVNTYGEIFISREVFAGLPIKAKVKISNNGNFASTPLGYELKALKMNIKGESGGFTPQLPPYGYVEYQYDLKTNSLWEGFTDELVLKYGDKTTNQTVLVKPFFSYNNFSLMVIGVVVGMLVAYLLTLGIHFRRTRRKS